MDNGGGGNLPNVGVRAVVLGMSQFAQAVGQVVRGGQQIIDSTKQVEVAASAAATRSQASYNNLTSAAARTSAVFAQHVADTARKFAASGEGLRTISRGIVNNIAADVEKAAARIKRATTEVRMPPPPPPPALARREPNDYMDRRFWENERRLYERDRGYRLNPYGRQPYVQRERAPRVQRDAIPDDRQSGQYLANIERAIRPTRELQRATADNVRAQRDYQRSLTTGGRTMANFSAAQRTIAIGFNQLARSSDDFTRTAVGGFASMAAVSRSGAAGVAAAALSIVTAMAGVSASFEQAIKSAEIFGNFSRREVDTLSDSVLRLAREWGISANEIASGAGELTKAGASFAQLEAGLLRTATALATASKGEASAAEAGKLLIQIMNAYQAPASAAAEIADALNAAIQSGTVSFTEMRQGLAQTLALAAQMNIPFKDLFTVLGLLNDQNIRGMQAGSAYRNLMIRMLDPVADVASVMTRYNISLQDANGKLISAPQLIARLSDAFSEQALAARGISEATAASDLATLGMSRTLLAATALANKGSAAFEKYQKDMAGVGTVADIANKQTDTTVKQLARLIEGVRGAAVAFGGPFNESLREGLKQVNLWFASINLSKLSAFATMLRDDIAAGIAAVGGAIKAQLGNLQGLLDSAAGAAVGNIDVSGYARAAQDMYAQAVQIVNDVVAAVAQGFTQVVAFAGRTAEAVVTTANNVIQSVVAIVNSLIETATNVLTAVGTVANNVYTTITRAVGAVVQRFVMAMQPLIEFLTTDVVQAAGPVLNVIKIVIAAAIVAARVFQDIQSQQQTNTQSSISLAQQLGFTWENMRKVFETIVADIGKKWDQIVEGADYVLTGMQTVLTVWRSQWRQIGETVSTVVTWIGDRIGDLFEWLSQQPFIGNYIKGLVTQFNNAKQAIGVVFADIAALPSNLFKRASEGVEQAGAGISAAIADIMARIQASMDAVGSTLQGVGINAQQAFEDAKAIVAGLIPDIAGIAANTQDFFTRLVAGVQNAVGTAVPAVQAYLEKIRAGLADIQQQGKIELAPTAAGTVGLPNREGAGDSVGFPTDELEKMVKHVQALLSGIPGITRDFAEFVAQLVKADPNRLQGIVAAMNAQAGAVRAILEQKRALLAVEIQIEQVSQRIAAIELQIARVTLEQQQALIPFEQQLLALSVARMQIELQMLPLQQAIAAIDRQIADLNREDYATLIARLKLQQQALPIEQRIAEIDRQIALTQRENYQLTLQRLQIQLRMLPIQEQIEDLQRQEAEANRENYALTRERLQVELNRLPLEQAMAAIDRQIADINRENYTIVVARLRLQEQAIPIEQAIAGIEQRIALLSRENYDVTLSRLLLQQDMLPVQNAIADVEQRLALLGRENFAVTRQLLELERDRVPLQRAVEQIDARINDLQRENYDRTIAALQLEQDSLGLRYRLSAVDTQISNTQRTNYATARLRAQAELELLPVRQRIADIEADIAASMDKQQELTMRRNELLAQRNVTDIQRELTDVEDQLEKLWARFSVRSTGPIAAGLVPDIINLEAERTRLENLLDPAQKALTVIKREQEDVNYNNELTRIGLEQLKLAEEALLAPIQERISALQREADATDARNALTLLGLQEQREALVALLAPYDAQIEAIERIQNEQRISIEIAVAGLNRQRQGLLDLQRPLDDRINQIEAERDAIDLNNQIAATYLQEELLRLSDVLMAMQDRLTAIDRDAAALQLRNDIARVGLQQELAQWQALLAPITDTIAAIDRERAAEDLRQAIAVAGLEQQKQLLEQMLRPLDDQLTRIQNIEAAQRILNAINATGFAERIAQLQGMLAPLQGILTAIEREEAATRLRNEIARTGLEIEKQRWLDLLQPITDAIAKIDAERAAEDLRKQIAIAGLELQKQLLQGLLQPLEDARRKIEEQTAVLTLQRDLASAIYEARKLQLEQTKVAEELYKNALEATRVKEQQRLAELIEKFQAALVASGAFTSAEAADAVTRLKLWGDEVSKLSGLRTEYDNINAALGGVKTGFTGIKTPAEDANAKLIAMKDIIGSINDGGSLLGRTNNLAATIGSNVSNSGLYGAFAGMRTPIDNTTIDMGEFRDKTILARDATFNLNDQLTGTFGLKNQLESVRAKLADVRDYFSGPEWAIRNRADLAADAMRALSVALVTPNNLWQALESVRVKLWDVKEYFSGPEWSVRNRTDLAKDSMYAFRDSMWGGSFSTGAYADNLVADLRDVRDHMAGPEWSVRSRTDLARDMMYQFRDAINAASFAMGNLNSNTIRFVATQAAATGVATGFYQRQINQGMNQIDAAYWTYVHVRDRLNDRQIGFAEGGLVPGPIGAPMLATVHGGEYVIPASVTRGREPTVVGTGSTGNTRNTNNYYNYQFAASYERQQDPITLSQDLRSVIELTRR